MSDARDFFTEKDSNPIPQNPIDIDDRRISLEVIERLRTIEKDPLVGKRLATDDLTFSEFHFPDSKLDILGGALWQSIVENTVPLGLIQLAEKFGRMIVYPSMGAVVLSMSNQHALVVEVAEPLSDSQRDQRGRPQQFQLVQDIIRNHQDVFTSKKGGLKERVIMVQVGKKPYVRRQSTHFVSSPGDALLSAVLAGLVYLNSTKDCNLLNLFALAETTKVEYLQGGGYVNFLMPARILYYIASHPNAVITLETIDQVFYNQQARVFDQRARHFLEYLANAGFIEKVTLDVVIQFDRDRSRDKLSDTARDLIAVLEQYQREITYSSLKALAINTWLEEGSAQNEKLAVHKFLRGMKQLKSAGIVKYDTEDAFEARVGFVTTESGKLALLKLEQILSNPLSFISETYEQDLETSNDLKKALFRVLPDGTFREIGEMPDFYRDAFFALRGNNPDLPVEQ